MASLQPTACRAIRAAAQSAGGAAPGIPFWLGEAPSRTPELSADVGDLRGDVERRLGVPDAAAEFEQTLRAHGGIAAAIVVIRQAETGPGAVEPIGFVRKMRFGCVELFFQMFLEVRDQRIDIKWLLHARIRAASFTILDKASIGADQHDRQQDGSHCGKRSRHRRDEPQQLEEKQQRNKC